VAYPLFAAFFSTNSGSACTARVLYSALKCFSSGIIIFTLNFLQTGPSLNDYNLLAAGFAKIS
jgi:hypothetical protein